MTVWYVNLEDMHHLECVQGFRHKLVPPSNWLYEVKGCWGLCFGFFGVFFCEPSCLDEAGTRPIQASTEHAAGACGAEGVSSPSKPLEQSLPKDGACACSLDKSVFSAPTIFCCGFILPPGNIAGPSGFRYIFKWLQNLQMWQTGSLCDTKWDEEGSENSMHTKRDE